jgi:hypothetical protein
MDAGFYERAEGVGVMFGAKLRYFPVWWFSVYYQTIRWNAAR